MAAENAKVDHPFVPDLVDQTYQGVRAYRSVPRRGLAGGVLGFLGYYLLPRERERAIAHLNLAFGEKGTRWTRRVARRCFEHLGKSLLETMLISPDRLDHVVEVHGKRTSEKR